LAFFLSTAISIVCRKGSANYKNEVLIQIIGELLPNSEYGWQAVAIAYHDQTMEEALCNLLDLKKHWIKICAIL
jgi:hypothetical protein